MENPIINAKPHKVIDSTAKALPQTVKAIDTALSGGYKNPWLPYFIFRRIRQLFTPKGKK